MISLPILILFFGAQIKFSEAAAVSRFEKTWNCQSGFSCSSQTLGLCGSGFEPYFPISNSRQPNPFSFEVQKPGAYACTVKVTADHFDFPEGKTDEPNEVTDISLNGNKIGTTEDRWCQPGSLPCLDPSPCSSDCLSKGCSTYQDNRGCDRCECFCKTPSETGNSMNALQGSSGSFDGSICFNITNINALINSPHREGEGAVIAFSNPNNREYFAIIHGIGGSILFHRFGFCFACSCTNWCGVGQAGTISAREGVTYKIQKTGPYTMTFSEGTNTITYNAANDNDNGATIQQKFPNGIELSQYCVGLGCAWNGHPFFPFTDGGAALTVFNCGSSGTTCDNDGICDAGETYANCPNDCGEPDCSRRTEPCSPDCCPGLVCRNNKCAPDIA